MVFGEEPGGVSGSVRGHDLVYEVGPAGVKEVFELSKAPSRTGTVSWQWRVDAGGLSLREEATTGGEILFEDAAGDVQLVIPRPAMWDSAGTLGDRANEQGDVDADASATGMSGW